MSLRTARFAASLAFVGSAGCGGKNGGEGLTLDKTSLSFSADGNGPLPASQSIHVTVSHSDAAFVVAGYPPGTTVAPWLALSFTGSGTSWNLQASIVSTAFDGGSYSVTVRVAIARQDESVIAYRDAQVTYTVANALTAAPSPLAFAQVTGGPQPPSQSIAVGGGSGTAWTASANQPWVLLSAASGTTPSIVNVSVNAAGLLAAGPYNAR